MSGNSKKSEVSSAGDGASVTSSCETGSRQSPDHGGSLECGGDFATSFITCPVLLKTDLLYKIDNSNSSTDSEDIENCDLKIEYLHRIDLIREKLASIDIANENYFRNCFAYPFDNDNRCTITEIIDDDLETDDAISDDKSKLKSAKRISGIDTNENSMDKVKIDNPETDNMHTAKINYDITEDAPEEGKIKCISENDKAPADCTPLKSKSMINLVDATAGNVAPNNLVSTGVKEKTSHLEIETIFHYSDLYKTESSTELFDLNYNPPKKKFCIRNKTPTLVMPKKSAKSSTWKSSPLEILEISKKSNEDPDDHPDSSSDQNMINRRNFVEDNGRFEWKNRGDITATKEIFDTVGQSRSRSPRSYRTIIEDIIGRVDKPECKSKKRRIFLRSARNKVKPIDNLTLWEEIRTLEAMNKRKRLESSCSKESSKKTTPNKVDSEPRIDLVAVDIPRKVSLPSRFPSTTKITKFCPFASKKKSQTNAKQQPSEEVPPPMAIKTIEELYVARHQRKELIPNVANTLLNSRREQDLCFDNEDTLTDEEQSDSSESEEDTVDYYQPYCLFCFCFN